MSHFPILNPGASASSRSVLCEGLGVKRQYFSKAYDDLNLAVRSAMLACRKCQDLRTSKSAAIMLPRPRGRPPGSKDTKPRSKKRSFGVGVSISTFPASAISPLGNTGLTPEPSSSLDTISFAHACGELYEAISCSDSRSLLQREFKPTLSNALPTSAVEDEGIIRQTPHRPHDNAAAAWHAGVASDPACWDLPLPC
jgi:hypothetical protein